MTFRRTLGTAVAGAALLVAAGAAQANTTVTWDPNALGLGTPAFDGPYSFNNITTADYTDIHVDTVGVSTLSYTETGLLNLSAFALSGSGTTPIGLGRPNGALNGYVLYASFTGTGTLPTSSLSLAVGQTATGTLNTLNYTLFAAPASGGTPTFTANTSGGHVSNIGGDITLATGSLITTGTATLTNSSTLGLSAQALFDATFVPDSTALADGFYITPTSYIGLDLFSSSTNTGTVLTNPDPSDLVVNGGGGNATFNAVPEPTSIAVMGMGLLGLARIVRRRRKV